MEADATCPYCGEAVSLFIDTGGASEQSYVEDCSVCCRPWQVSVTVDDEGNPCVNICRLDD